MTLRNISRTEYVLSRILAAVDRFSRRESDLVALRFRLPRQGDIYPRAFNAGTAAVANNAGQFLPSNPRRVALLLRAETAATIRVWPLPSVSSTVGFIPNQTDYTEFTRDKHGDLVTSDWYAISGVGAQTLTFVEVF